MEVPSTVSGIVRRVIAAEGQQLREGDAVVEVEVSGAAAPPWVQGCEPV